MTSIKLVSLRDQSITVLRSFKVLVYMQL